MMVEMLVSMAGPHFSFSPGDIVEDFADWEVESLIENGYAVLVEEEVEEEQPKSKAKKKK